MSDQTKAANQDLLDVNSEVRRSRREKLEEVLNCERELLSFASRDRANNKYSQWVKIAQPGNSSS